MAWEAELILELELSLSTTSESRIESMFPPRLPPKLLTRLGPSSLSLPPLVDRELAIYCTGVAP